MPSLSASTYASTEFPLAKLGAAEKQLKQAIANQVAGGMFQPEPNHWADNRVKVPALNAHIQKFVNQAAEELQPVSTARIVKVFIADTNDNLPLANRILYSGDEKLTDLTDQELFFEVPIKDLLDQHNAVRAKTQDKKQTEKFGREIFLEPARIRDLKMVVVNVAQF